MNQPKFKREDVGKTVFRTQNGDPIDDVILAVPGMPEYDEKYPPDADHNQAGVMLRDHPWESEDNWELKR